MEKTLVVPLKFDIEIPYSSYIKRITDEIDIELDRAMPQIKSEIQRSVAFWANEFVAEHKVKTIIEETVRKAVVQQVHAELSMEIVRKSVKAALRETIRKTINEELEKNPL